MRGPLRSLRAPIPWEARVFVFAPGHWLLWPSVNSDPDSRLTLINLSSRVLFPAAATHGRFAAATPRWDVHADVKQTFEISAGKFVVAQDSFHAEFDPSMYVRCCLLCCVA